MCAIPSRWRGKTAVCTPTQETDAVVMQKRSRADCRTRTSQAQATPTAAETCRRHRKRANAASKQEVTDVNTYTGDDITLAIDKGYTLSVAV